MTSDFDRGPVDEETPDPADIAKWCKAKAKEGANALHARAKYVKPPQLTDAESAALARKRADQEATR